MSLSHSIPVLTPPAAPDWLSRSRRPFHDSLFAFYSSEYGGIVTDPLFMNVPIDDHLVHRGDGVFETLKCTGGRIYCFNEHLDRLFYSAGRISIASPWPREEIGRIVLATVRAANRRDCLVRVLLSRGPGSMGVSPLDCPRPGLYILVHKAVPPFMSAHPGGARVVTSDVPVKAGEYATIKTCNYLPNAMMKKQAVERGADFAVGFDEAGFVAEGATENLGILTAHQVLVIPNPGRILNGTTMLRAFDLAGEGVREGWLAGRQHARITREELLAAPEVFIFGTTTDVTAVVEIDGRPVGDGKPGPVQAELNRLVLAEQASDNPHSVPAFA